MFERGIHERLLNRDVTASEELARQYLPLVRRHVQARANKHGVQDEALINDAATDATFDYIRYPSKFDPGRSSLLGHLKRAAERDLINAVQKDRRRRRGEELSDDVELTLRRRNKPSDIRKIIRDAEAEVLGSLEPARGMDEVLADIEEPRDKKLLKLMAAGERRTTVFAALLGITELSQSKQQKVVKQHKDRLKKQLQRSGGKGRG